MLASTAAKLERDLRHGESLFDRHPVTVVSLDYVKSRRRRDDYIQAAPDLLIVDEAHLCAKDPANTSKHLRHELLTGLADAAGDDVVDHGRVEVVAFDQAAQRR